MNVYANCPRMENERFLLRFVSEGDCGELLKVYSDPDAVPLFNSDNCHGDDFHYTTAERMLQAVQFWLWSYEQGHFVRWSIVDKRLNTVIGSVELFRRVSEDSYNGSGILRLDLRSDYEKQAYVESILGLAVPPAFGWFGCERIITKAKPIAGERINTLKKLGFTPGSAPLIGHDGTAYGDYWVCTM